MLQVHKSVEKIIEVICVQWSTRSKDRLENF